MRLDLELLTGGCGDGALAGGVTIWSGLEPLGVEIDSDGRLMLVEYKIGTRHGRAANIQLCAQSLCLAEMTGTNIDHGYVWYSTHRSRDQVVFDDELIDATLGAIQEVRATLTTRRLPPAPAVERCDACQLSAVCLPNIVAADQRVRRYLADRFA